MKKKRIYTNVHPTENVIIVRTSNVFTRVCKYTHTVGIRVGILR